MSSPQRPAQGRVDEAAADEVAVALSPGSPSEPHGPDGRAAQGPVMAGTVLGNRYRVGERVGAGGMATIYRGFDETLERPVAVKVLHAHLADDAELRSRFRTEARHAASLSHPHIVAVYDQGVADLPYIVMELIEGPSLREVLAQHGPLPESKALAVIEPVARALARAHAAGLVHRDIKPENVLVAEDGAPKVADFGIARIIAGTSHTQTGALIGSVHYMAPELVDGKEASPASDQYAVGVLLYELLTGQRPFAGDSPMAVALRHTRDRVPQPSSQGADCGPEIDAVVARATEHGPADRYAGMAGLAAALRAAVPQGPSAVEVDADDGHTLVIPAEATLTTPRDLHEDVAARLVPLPQPAQESGALGARHRQATADRQSRPRVPVAGAWRGRGSDRPAAAADDSPGTPAAAAYRSPDPPAEPTKPQRSRRLRRVLVAALLTVVLLVAAAGGGYAWWHYLIAPVTDVPELVTLSEEEAFDVTSELGLGLTIDGLRYDFDAPEGQVLSQEPSPRTELRRGDDVSVVLSQGPEPVTMPGVAGEPEPDAVAALSAERLEVAVDYAHHDDVAEGLVISQDPAADRSLHQGDAVEILVSLGIEQVEVPVLEGRDRGEVEALLSDAGLELGEVSRVWSDEVPTEGEVISQSLDAEATVDKGSTVDVTTSLGRRTIEVPDVRGEAIGDARSTIETMVLEVEIVEQPRQRFGPIVRGRVGYVEEQLPAAGEPITRGDTVTLYTYSE